MKSECNNSGFYRKTFIFNVILYILNSVLEKLNTKIFCTEVNFYFIHEKYVEEIISTKRLHTMRIPICDQLREYETACLLENRVIMCNSTFNKVEYFSYKIFSIEYPKDLILESNLIESYIKSGETTIHIFLGNFSILSLMKFFKLISSLDGFISQIQLNEFIQYTKFLSIFKMNRTENRKYFLKNFVLHVIMDPGFLEKNSYFLTTVYDKYEDLDKELINEIFNIFLYFNLVKQKKESCFFSPKIGPMYSPEIKSNFLTYEYLTEKYNKFTILQITDDDLKSIFNVMDHDTFIARFHFLLRMMNIDVLFINISEISEKILISYFKIKPNKLTKIYFVENGSDQYILDILISTNYFDGIDIVKIYSEFEIEKIDYIVKMCVRCKKIKVSNVIYFEKTVKTLLKFAEENKNISVKYQIQRFIITFGNLILLQDIPENMIVVVGQVNFEILAYIRLEFICIYDFIKNIEITFRKDKAGQELILKCKNVKSLFLISEDMKCNFKFKAKWIQYLENSKNLEILVFKNIILPKEMLNFILNSNSLVYVGFFETKFPQSFTIHPKFNHNNTHIRGFGFSNTKIVLKNSFLRYIARFSNLKFLKLNITRIKETLLKNYKKESNASNFQTPKVLLKYLEIKASLNIPKERLSILSILSRYFEMKFISSLIIQVYDILQEEYRIINDLNNLENLYIHLNTKINIPILNIFENISHISKIVNITLDIFKCNDLDPLVLRKFKNLKFLNLYCYEIDTTSIQILDSQTVIGDLIIRITTYDNTYESFTERNMLYELRLIE
ncbi:hypothetical protein CWI38_1106p0020 [Hamiltosporidium tvaerminnensis]|uniref:Uncharacterized protein n=2 Tax=Hamiltosporidium tvaerminnensis TaxID=1176355 RepID=A0A4Q9LTK6_9MICR|nr:hypothetical protein CWI38_1106p0020 [Hamiltosporidium tvaerminnensis]